MTSDFTLAGYKAMLEEFLNRGYSTSCFDDADPDQRHLVLRHDLDMSIQAALPMASIEHALGLTASYFVLIRTEMYNPFSDRTLTGLKQLASLGHEIGLHVDASLYPEDIDSLDIAVERECAILEMFTGYRIQFLSFHRPASHLLGLDRLVAGRRHTYEPKFFSDLGYCSDSRGRWHHGHPLKSPSVAQGRGLQLLTHPIWWDAGLNESVRSKLDRLALTRFDLVRAELARNCESYPQEFQALDPEIRPTPPSSSDR